MRAPTPPSSHMQLLGRQSWLKTGPAPKSNRRPPQWPVRLQPPPSRSRTVGHSTRLPLNSNNIKTKTQRMSMKQMSLRRMTSSKWRNRLQPTTLSNIKSQLQLKRPDPTKLTQRPTRQLPIPAILTPNNNKQKQAKGVPTATR